jgi:hypothetical protein
MEKFFKYKERVGFVLANVLLATFCFFLGVIYGSWQNLSLKEPKISFESAEVQESIIDSTTNINKENLEKVENSKNENKNQNEILFVASKKGKVYHLPWCPGAKAIQEDNKIYFSSREEAEKAGYRPAKNCPGL